jgi:hypothetical protein
LGKPLDSGLALDPICLTEKWYWPMKPFEGFARLTLSLSKLF